MWLLTIWSLVQVQLEEMFASCSKLLNLFLRCSQMVRHSFLVRTLKGSNPFISKINIFQIYGLTMA